MVVYDIYLLQIFGSEKTVISRQSKISTQTCIDTTELVYLVSVLLKCVVLPSFADVKIFSLWLQELIKTSVQTRGSKPVP